jgi:predicted peptidase
MKKWLVVGVLIAAVCTFESCQGGPQAKSSADASVYSFTLVNQVFGYGQDTAYVIIDAQEPIRANSVAVGDFAVHAVNTWPEGFDLSLVENNTVAAEADRPILKAFVSASGAWDDATNAPPAALSGTAGGRYIWLELETRLLKAGSQSPVFAGIPGANTMGYTGSKNYILDLGHTVAFANGGTIITMGGKTITEGSFAKSMARGVNEVNSGEINPLINKYVAGKYTPPNPADTSDYLDYQLYSPASASGRLPIMIWLHGGGEGRSLYGIQNQAQMRSCEEASAWVKNENLAARGPYYVLVPQSRIDGWTDSALANVKAVVDGLIAAGKVDPSRIYVAGDSMGGSGTMNIIRKYPNYFAAAIGAPGAVANYTDADVESILHLPIWFLNIEEDTPNTQVLYNQIKAKGGNVRWTHYNSVTELAYNNYEIPHYVWVPTLENLPTTSDQWMVEKYPSDQPNQRIQDWIFAQRNNRLP